ncbi:peptide ABC transporter substrate-binding protein [bacterium]|nr:MAG: peptide ABC transporter substrate-binding protein [bacterium]
MKRRDALSMLVATAVLPSCTKVSTVGGEAATRHPWTQPHVLRWADGQDPVGLNPVVTTHATTSWLAELWGAWLFRYDERLNPVPELATEIPSVENGLLSRDGKRIVFKLRREARWHDGRPFTARDVAFSVALIQDPNTNVTSRDGWDQVMRVETPDDHTAIFHMKSLYSSFLPTFFTTGGANPCILPEHICKGQNANTGPYNQQPVGTGPFKVDQWQRGQHVDLSANPDYWRGRPKLERVVYKIIPDANTMLTQMRSHELDLWVQMNPNYLQQITGADGVAVMRRPSQYWRHIDCNCEHPALKDVVVRQALNYAIDRAALLEKVLHGVGSINWTVVSPDSYAYDAGVKRYPFDLAKANALLDRAGWARGADGVRAKGGVRLHFDFALATGSPAYEQIIELLRSSWRQIGVGFETKHYPTTLYFAQQQNGGIVNSGKFDLAIFSWGNTPAPTDMYLLYASTQIPPNGQNDLRYVNPELTQILGEARGTLDRAKQTALLKKAQEIVAQECPTFPLEQNEDLYPYNADLKNFSPNANAPFDFMLDVDI